jgi:hypothetical protein
VAPSSSAANKAKRLETRHSTTSQFQFALDPDAVARRQRNHVQHPIDPENCSGVCRERANMPMEPPPSSSPPRRGLRRSAQTLVAPRGIAAFRLKRFGFGPLYPIESNNSGIGRAKSRRVELVEQFAKQDLGILFAFDNGTLFFLGNFARRYLCLRKFHNLLFETDVGSERVPDRRDEVGNLSLGMGRRVQYDPDHLILQAFHPFL